ncbi:MAG: FkbM family methyltransferase [Chitinophagaceae bacterium]|nr:FkbM family methyltransferase [Chitinophagaceae bacterium]
MKYIASFSPIALTKNEQYDRLTFRVLKKVCTPTSVCVDVGANEGKVLMLMHKVAPLAKHIAFEPIPVLYNQLYKKYNHIAQVFEVALSNRKGISTFNCVLTNMAYSGLLKRPYDRVEEDTQIEVQTNLLDAYIAATSNIQLIKIDVEGGEMLVLQGAIQTLQRCKPIVLFEFGMAGANAYGVNPLAMFQFFSETLNYEIFTLQNWLKGNAALSFSQFNSLYEANTEYFFLAAPTTANQ